MLIFKNILGETGKSSPRKLRLLAASTSSEKMYKIQFDLEVSIKSYFKPEGSTFENRNIEKMGNSTSNAYPGTLYTGLFDYPPLRRVKNPSENNGIYTGSTALDGIADYGYDHAAIYGIYDDMKAMYDTVYWLLPVLIFTVCLVSLLLILLFCHNEDLRKDRKSTEDKYPDYEYPKHYKV